MAKNTKAFVQDFAFYEQLWEYYSQNRGKIRSRYNDLTKKFLAYNDSNENSDAFLREPQFEALEMYVFIKEFMDNAHMYQMFDEWRKRENRFSDASYYTIHKGGQGTLLDIGDEQNEIVFKQMKNNFTPKEEAKSFHADTYCFDSKPEKECFLQYISSNKVKEIYFTGMFTSNQGDLSVQYYDPESKRLRKYYPDFLALMEDGSYQLIEVKGDNKIDDEVVLAKKAAAEEMAVASGVHYLMYAGSTLMKSNVLEPTLAVQQTSIDI